MTDLFDYQPGQCTIERGVHIPSSRVSRHRVRWDNLRDKLPFDDMQIGDSFAIHPEWVEGADTLRAQNFLTGAACSYRATREPGTWAFTTRQMPDGSVRCWRIDPSEARHRGDEA